MKTLWFLFLSIITACSSPKDTPATLPISDSSKTVLVTKDEPGDILVVSGTVYADDDITAVHGARMFVYHTDQKGYYSPENDPRNPRIKGSLTTDSSGAYEFLTILPGAYPSGGNPAHIHFVVKHDGYFDAEPELLFDGDRYLKQEDYQREAALGRFGSIRKLHKDSAGVSRCNFDIKLRKK